MADRTDWKSLAVQLAIERDRERKRKQEALDELLRAKARWSSADLYDVIQRAVTSLKA